MKKIALALIPAIALAACSEAETTDTAEPGTSDTVIINEAADPATTTVVNEDAPDGDRVSVDRDGVSADITDGNTRVRADVDGDPSISVEVD